MKKAKCTACGRPISFIRTKNGKMMPIEEGEFFIIPDRYGRIFCTVDGTMLLGHEAPQSNPKRVYAHKPHWAYCPKSPRKAEMQAEKQRLERIAVSTAKREAEEAARREELRLKEAQKQWEEAQTCLFGNRRSG